MPQSKEHFTVQEFAKKAGVSASTISKWLRSGKLSGAKQNGKWIIHAAELDRISAPKSQPTTKKQTPKSKSASPAGSESVKTTGESFSVEEFSAMTFLTEFGVHKWIKDGKISITRDSSGMIRIDPSNLNDPKIKRLVRK